MAFETDANALPLYGCLTGIELPVEVFTLAPGIELRRGVFEIFSSPMLAFKEAPVGSHTPGPWVAVHGGFSFKSRVELAIENLSFLPGFSPSQTAWFVGALLRLAIETPIRVAVVANTTLSNLVEKKEPWPVAFEWSQSHIGLFKEMRQELSLEDLMWLADTLPVAARLYQDERFMRSFSIFDQSVWSDRLELGTVLIWTAIEILFDISSERQKTKAICAALSDWVALDDADRDRAYNVIRGLYEKRGRAVHAGREIDQLDFGQSFALARAAFRNVLGRAELPKAWGAEMSENAGERRSGDA